MTELVLSQRRSEEELVPRAPRVRWLLIGAITLVVAVVAGVLVGPVSLGIGNVFRRLAGVLPFVGNSSSLSPQQDAILMQLRLPRVVLGGIVGGTLAVSGAAYQGAFRNPLADPYLLGVASGAGLGATLAIGYTGAHAGSHLIPPFAFAGAMCAMAISFVMGRAARGRTPAALILAGIAVASFFTAVQTFLQQRKADTLREVYSWILGRLSTAGWSDVILVLPYVTVGVAVILAHRRLLDVMAVGDEEAESLGARARRIRLIVVAAASLATAAAVAVSGLIGFVGIIVPHLVRLVAGSSYRILLPLALLFGASFLILADVLGRTLITPAELPIGVVTAFVGGPFFVFVLRTSRKTT
jgi:cobalamin transport system permease protein